MALEFDHIFIFTEVEAPAVEQLAAFGLTEGQPNVHPGQGTACRRIFFHNVMLELLWVRDAAEVQSDVIASTRLWERSRSHQSGYSPFDLCFRPGDSASSELPFASWSYRPPYLPPQLQIDVAANQSHPAEPMIFSIPFGGRPDAYPAKKRQPLDHSIGFEEITGLTLTLTPQNSKSAALDAIELDGFIPLKVRSLVGLMPLLAVETMEPDLLEEMAVFTRRMHWFTNNRPHLSGNMASIEVEGVGRRHLVTILTRERLISVLRYLLDENEPFTHPQPRADRRRDTGLPTPPLRQLPHRPPAPETFHLVAPRLCRLHRRRDPLQRTRYLSG